MHLISSETLKYKSGIFHAITVFRNHKQFLFARIAFDIVFSRTIEPETIITFKSLVVVF